MYCIRSGSQIHPLEEDLIIGVLSEMAIFFLENSSIVTFHLIAFSIVFSIFFNGINEEQAQNFDALWRETLFLIKMLFDRAANHLTLHGEGLHVTVCLPRQ